MKQGYKFTLDQINAIESALQLAQYFVDDNKGCSEIEQWQSDLETVESARLALTEAKINAIS
jgi:hypothetical protein